MMCAQHSQHASPMAPVRHEARRDTHGHELLEEKLARVRDLDLRNADSLVA